MGSLPRACIEGAVLVSPLFAGLIVHGVCIRFGWLRRLAVPIDRGRHLRGRRLFGDNKTYRGIVCVALGTSLGFALLSSLNAGLRRETGWPAGSMAALVGLGVGIAAMLAELPNSALKRQVDIRPGAQARGGMGWLFHVLDQVDVLAGAWLVVTLFVAPTAGRLLGSFLVIYLGHQLVTGLGYLLGMRATAR